MHLGITVPGTVLASPCAVRDDDGPKWDVADVTGPSSPSLAGALSTLRELRWVAATVVAATVAAIAFGDGRYVQRAEATQARDEAASRLELLDRKMDRVLTELGRAQGGIDRLLAGQDHGAGPKRAP